MDYLSAATMVSMVIAFFLMLPWFIKGIHNYSRWFLYAGTAALLSIALFDLLPEMIEAGGATSLLIMGAVWLFFSGIHVWESRKRHPNHHAGHSPNMLLISLGLHSFSSGMLLVSSYDISARLVEGVFWGLLVHKAFEALSLSSMLIARAESRASAIRYSIAYAMTFPLGVLATGILRGLAGARLPGESVEMIAMFLTSIALGSLFGCLLHDFILPSYRAFRTPRTLEVG